MRPELLGDNHGKKVYLVDYPEDYDDYDDIVVERSSYEVYYKGCLIGQLARNRKEFSRFDEDTFNRLKRNAYWAQETEKFVKEEIKGTPAAEPTLTTVPSLLDNELKFDNSIFKSFADYIDNELRILKEKDYETKRGV